jgi:hypothetical protein
VIEILIPPELRRDIDGAPQHWDAHFIDVKLRDGRVKRGVSAREGIAICESGVHRPNYPENLDFTSDEISAVRPASLLLPFFVTELVRKWRNT